MARFDLTDAEWAVIAPLLGLLGMLNAMGRILRTSATISDGVTSWGPAVSGALTFLTVGITIATLSVVAYDALSVRIERLSGAIDRLGAETIDAIAMTAAAKSSAILAESSSSRVLGIHSGHDVISRPASASDSTRHPRRLGESRAAAGRQTGHDLGS